MLVLAPVLVEWEVRGPGRELALVEWEAPELGLAQGLALDRVPVRDRDQGPV